MKGLFPPSGFLSLYKDFEEKTTGNVVPVETK